MKTNAVRLRAYTCPPAGGKGTKRLTSEELATASGVPLGTINKIFSGATTEPKLPSLMALATALGVSVDYLIYGPVDGGVQLSLLERQALEALRQRDEKTQELALLALLRLLGAE